MGRSGERAGRGRSKASKASKASGASEKAAALRKHRVPADPGRAPEADRTSVNPFMPGLHIREDGWTAARTRTFLALLRQTGCVADAARVAGVSTTSVNRSRRLFAPFDRACAEARADALRGLVAIAYERAVHGRETVVIRDGKEVERRIVPSDSLLRLLIQRGDLSGALGRALSPAEAEAFVLPEAVRHRFIDRAEFEAGIVFEAGVKAQRHIATQDEVDAVLLRRIGMVERQRGTERLDHPPCAACGQPMPLTTVELDPLFAADPPPKRLPPPADDASPPA